MFTDIRHKPLDYFLLLTIISSGLVSFFLFSFDKTLRLTIVLITALAYFLWGMLHHWRNKDLNLRIVLEYLLLSILAAVFYTVVST